MLLSSGGAQADSNVAIDGNVTPYTTQFNTIDNKYVAVEAVADLEGGRAGSSPFGRRTDAVTHGTPDM